MAHLASGGMADVLLGRTEGLEGFQRHVVLKRIRPEHAHDERFIRMLLAEARVAANLHHHNIVQVHDVGEDGGEYFLAMEYLHGEDLRTILARAAKQRVHVPLDHAIAIVSAAAAGLHYAHERRDSDNRPLGIVHRDISPSNLLVSYDGSVKIVDFGIAKAVASANEDTHSGHLRGKISYMSPEQCRGDRVDRRSDVYALGVVLYEIATTKRLFKGENNYRVMEAIVNGQIVEPRTRRPELPAKLSEIIMRALATDPERRFATADDLRVALDQLSRRLGLNSSAPAIAAYMRDQFGERPEPWVNLDGALPHVVPQALAPRFDEPSRSRTVSAPWQTGPIATQARREGAQYAPYAPHARPATERYVAEAEALPPPPLAPLVPSQRPTAGPRPIASPNVGRSAAAKALIAVPLFVVLGIVVWQLTADRGEGAAAVAVAAPANSAGRSTAAGTAPAGGAPAPSAVAPMAGASAPGAAASVPGAAASVPGAAASAPGTAASARGAAASAQAAAHPAASSPASQPASQPAVHASSVAGPARVAVAPIAEPPPRQDAAAREASRAQPRGETAALRRAATVKHADASPDPSPAQHVATPAGSSPAPAARASESSAAPPPAVAEAPPPSPAAPRIAPPSAVEPPPAPPPSTALVPLDANRIGGDKNIVPDDLTQTEVRRRGVERLIGIYKVCITASGDINSVSQVKSTGFAAYDRKIQTTIRTTWRYRPFVVNGQAAPACSAVQLAYVAQG